MLRRFLCPRMLFPLTVLLATGCAPQAQPVWLRDSSGFLVPRTDGSVLHYDVRMQATRQLLVPGQCLVNRVAVSPDNRLAAIAAAGWGPQSRSVAIALVRLADGQMQAIDKQDWARPEAARSPVPTSTYWCPSGNRVLICYRAEDMLDCLFVLYDVRSRQMAELTTSPPAVALASMLNISPMLPDGSGYLAFKPAQDELQLSCIHWNGWEHPIAVSPALRDRVKTLNRSGAVKNAKTTPLLSSGRWLGNELTVLTQYGLIRISIDQKRATLEPLSVAQQQLAQTMMQLEPKDDAWSAYQIESFQQGPWAVRCLTRQPGQPAPAKIELIDLAAKQPRTLLEGTLMPGVPERPLTPSPDGRHILVSLVQRGRGTIHVIRNDGAITTQLDTGIVETRKN